MGVKAMVSSSRLRQIADTVQVKVTARHIATAVRQDSHRCMIQMAIADAVAGAQYITVDRRTVRWSENGRRYIYLTPASAGQRLTDFDEGRPVRPFTLRLFDGFSEAAGWKAQHPNSSRAGKRYRKARRVRVVVRKTRLDGYQVTDIR